PLPRRLKIVRIEPGRVKVRLERLVRRTVPVRAELAGLPPLGYTAEASVTPGEVDASGPANKVEELKEIKTEPVELRGAPEPRSRTVLLSWAGDFVSFTPDRVTVAVTFRPTMMSRKFDHVEVGVRGVGEGLRAKLVPARIDFTVQGPQSVLSNYALDAGSVYVDAAGLEPGSYRVAPKIELPQSIEVTRREPEVQTLEPAMSSGICSMGVDVLLVGPMPTPGIAFLTRTLRADAGVVISASHNPFQDNGIKFFSQAGFKLPDELEEEIEHLVLGDAID